MNQRSTDFDVLRVGIEAGDLLVEIHQAAFGEEHAAGWQARDFTELLATPGNVALIAINNGQEAKRVPAGLVVFNCIAGESEILTLGVLPAFRRQNIGNLLLKRMAEFLKSAGVGKMFLEVREDNFPALGLYKRYGYKPVGRRKSYYALKDGRKMDAIVMCCELEQ